MKITVTEEIITTLFLWHWYGTVGAFSCTENDWTIPIKELINYGTQLIIRGHQAIIWLTVCWNLGQLVNSWFSLPLLPFFFYKQATCIIIQANHKNEQIFWDWYVKTVTLYNVWWSGIFITIIAIGKDHSPVDNNI